MYIQIGKYLKYKHIISYMPVVIYTQPSSALKITGSDYTFNTFIRGSDPLSYQWYKNNLPIINENTDKLSLTSVQLSDIGYYYCKVGNARYSINTDQVLLSVMNPPSILIQPQSIAISTLIDEISCFTVTASSEGSINYQWYGKTGTNPFITLNSKASSYCVRSITTDWSTEYFVTITNEVSTISSNIVTLTIT